jgi:hypothetical protein
MLAMGAFSSALLLTLLRALALAALPWLHLPAIQQHEMVELTAWLVLALTAAATVIGYLNARRTAAVVEVSVPIANLPAALEGFTIVQISDIHVGPTIKAPYLQAIVDKVNALQPDVVAITGDLVDGSVRQLARTPRRWRNCARVTAPTSSPATTSTTPMPMNGSTKCAAWA